MSINSPLAPLYSELSHRFPGHLFGSPEGHIVVISERALSEQTYRALASSAIADGFVSFPFDLFPAPILHGRSEGKKETSGPLTLVTLAAEGQPSGKGESIESAQSSASSLIQNDDTQSPAEPESNYEGQAGNEGVSRETLLSPTDLILTIETLDPLAVISTDMASAKALADAYRTQIRLNTPQTLLGRPLRCFENFDSMISTNEGKRNAWKLLKNVSIDRP